MKGIPKHLNSRSDYLYVKENYSPDIWKPFWQNLLDTQYIWVPTDILKREEQCVVNDTHRYEILPPVEGTDDPVRYQQYELQINPECDLLQFGFTEEEVKRALAS